MLPLLQAIGDGKDHAFEDVVRRLQHSCGLTRAERLDQLSDGRSRFYNRAEFAKKYLSEAGLLIRARRYVRITAAGRKVLQTPPSMINKQFLDCYPGFRKYMARSQPKPKGGARRLGKRSSTRAAST
jgi:restriction system protein